ncbi:sporulation membrane protein YtaF [Thermosediminibacter oceani]|uniref:Sporulation protein YtaF n=1 Tax=Thermosediminibacter oceani (strain ATCC BAA-1034 / DSM 16646 / JW/IW-1228P) TaxID=555079 RepID=D9RYC6_THEOJ|nr:sporulation membrane protein YtaF [Thermosediminibacter oceani]ADL08350.1 sporulation protein YtaF [Thermosediminibacter oceani DSM 16646]
MPELLSSFLLAVAVSVDSFSAGIAYGMRKIKIPVLSQLIIAFSTSVALSLAMAGGKLLEKFISPHLTEYAGSFILFLLGVSSLRETLARRDLPEDRQNPRPRMIATFKIKPLGLVVKILKEPVVADLNISGTIETREAFLLGTALALDAFGAGLGAGAAGFKVLPTITLVTFMGFIFMMIGLHLGFKRFQGQKSYFSFIPGGLFIFLAVARVLWKF